MKKKIYAILLSLVMVVTMMPAFALTAFATDEIPLQEETRVTNELQLQQEAEEQSANEDKKVINGDTTELSGEYTVSEQIIVIKQRLNVEDTAIINLEEGCELIIYGGIHVQENRSLTIKGNGTLTINGVPDRCAGIGGNDHENCGKVIIEGGQITVTGGRNAAGIGGGNYGVGGTVKISGGVVIATGGYYGAGIGGGTNGAGGTVEIIGGTVTALGGDRGAGIGSGITYLRGKVETGLSGGIVNISDGVVTARGGSWASGIGGGSRGSGVTVTITGGNVTAIGGGDDVSGGGAGIGGGCGRARDRFGDGGEVTIEDGIVTATGAFGAAGIGGGISGAGGSLTVNGGIVTVTGGKKASAIGRGFMPDSKAGCQFTLNNELHVFDISNDGPAIYIENPINNVPDKIKRVLIRRPANIAVEPTVVTYPLKYNDTYQNGYISLGENVQIAGRESAKDVGVYTFTAIPIEGCVWEDYTADPKTYTWSIVRADYTDVAKTISAEVEAKRGQSVTIDLPIPEGARYGIPQKKDFNDPYMLSPIDEGNIIFIMLKATTKPMIFTVPVIPDHNHNGYVITVTVTPKIDGLDDEGGSYDSGGTDIDSSKPSPDKTDAKSITQSNISTGDSNEVVIYTVIGLVALIGIALAFALKKRINR